MALSSLSFKTLDGTFLYADCSALHLLSLPERIISVLNRIFQSNSHFGLSPCFDLVLACSPSSWSLCSSPFNSPQPTTCNISLLTLYLHFSFTSSNVDVKSIRELDSERLYSISAHCINLIDPDRKMPVVSLP